MGLAFPTDASEPESCPPGRFSPVARIRAVDSARAGLRFDGLNHVRALVTQHRFRRMARGRTFPHNALHLASATRGPVRSRSPSWRRRRNLGTGRDREADLPSGAQRSSRWSADTTVAGHAVSRSAAWGPVNELPAAIPGPTRATSSIPGFAFAFVLVSSLRTGELTYPR